MKLLFFIIISLFVPHFAFSQSVIAKLNATEIEQMDTWHYLLALDDGGAAFIYTNPGKTSFFIKRYDKDATLILDKKITELKETKSGGIEVSEMFEINNSLTFFISVASKNSIRFLRIITNTQTGEKISEEELSSYSGLDKKHIESKNYLFDFTKNDSAGMYYFSTFVRTNENNSELKIFGYNYENKPVSSLSKNITKNYTTTNYISSIQEGKNYYFALNYVQGIKKSLSTSKQDLILYKFSGTMLEELPLQLEKTERPYSYIAGQFTVNHNEQVRLAISNSYTTKIENVNINNPKASDVYVFGLRNDKLEIANKYTVSQSKLHESYKNIRLINDKDKIYLYNVLVNFHTTPDNQDELVFQSYGDKRNGEVLASSIEDLGIFSFSEAGTITNSNHFPLKWDGTMLYSFKYNVSNRGKTPNAYSFYSPLYITPHKHINFITYHYKTYIFYNDLIENLNITNRDEIKNFGRLRDASGTAITIDSDIASKILIIPTNEQLYFDFSTTNCNLKNGRCAVIINKNKKFYLGYLDLK